MIARFAAFVIVLYALGFVLFAVTLGRPADAPRTEAAVVLTGGGGRIERGIEVVRQGRAARLLIAGADPLVTKADLANRVPGSARTMRCCVDLGSESVDTRSNAEEAQRWLAKGRYKSVRLITSDWHMRRAEYEFRRVLEKRYEIVTDGVRTEPSFLTLFAEYNKYVLRRLAMWLEI